MHDCRIDRAGFMRGGLAALTLAGISGLPEVVRAANSGPPEMTPDAALARLMAGNAKFVAGSLQPSEALVERRADVANGQRPFAMVLTCADSRLPPEHIFHETVGDLFVCRVAGNILEPGALGSFEYAIAMIGSPAVLMVLGHEHCGAVKDSIALTKAQQKAPGDIAVIVDAIAPVIAATPQGSMSDAAYVQAVMIANAKHVAHEIATRSEIVEKAIAAHQLKVVAARYALDSGKVTLI
jgi:carbonic anhydrase